MKDFEPKTTTTTEAISQLKDSGTRAGTLARVALQSEDPTPLTRLRVERQIYMDNLAKLSEAIYERRL